MIHALAFLLSLAGFAALALATERQQDDLFGRTLAPLQTRRLRLAGTLLLLACLALLVSQIGWGLGLVLFSGHTSLCAGVIYAALIVYMRRRARLTT